MNSTYAFGGGYGPCGPHKPYTLFLSQHILVSCFFFLPFSLHALSFIITTCHLFAIISSSMMKIEKMLENEDNGFEEEEKGEEGEMEDFKECNLKKRFNLGGGGGTGMSALAGGGGGMAQPWCMVDKCEVDLRGCKKYYQRHKVCEVHSKAPEVIVSGMMQRFCQQCSRFHEVSEFDQTKRSCRTRLAGHNERRRQSSSRLVKRAQTSEDSRTKSPGSIMAFSEKQSYKIARMSL